VRFVALILLVIGGPLATQAFAEETGPQPLTRADCDKAGLTWNDNANVCDVAFDEAESTVGTSQPLTRKDCDRAGMRWNDSANVCDDKSEEAAIQIGAAAASASEILISIDKAAQKMTVSVDGDQRYDWKVSTGRAGYDTPSGNFTASSMNEIWYSKEWDDAPMPHAIFFTKDGHAIHSTEEVKNLGKPASHGCVRLSPQNAATLYTLVAENGLESTQVVLAGLTPGRAKQGPRPTAAAPRDRKAARGSTSTPQPWSVSPRDESLAEQGPKKRSGGLFKRLFGRR